MSKVDREIKAILAKSDIKVLLDNIYADLANITGIIVIIEHKKGASRVLSSLDYGTTVVELETAKTYLINERLDGFYEDEDEEGD